MSVFVVTGTRSGIGLEYVRQISQDSSNTVVGLVRGLDGDLAALNEVRAHSSGNVHIVECDISSEASLASLSKKLNEAIGADTRVNVLINNAAILHSREQTALDFSAEALHSHMETNVLGPAKVTQALLPRLAQGAVVANVTSSFGSMQMITDGRMKAELAPYSLSKAALNMLTVHQAKLLAGKAAVVCIDPGHVKTKMGGPDGPGLPEDSAKEVLSTLAGLRAEDTGKFLESTGAELPW